MKLTDLTPGEYRSAELVDLHLGRAVQAAWRNGQADAKQGHEAEATMRNRVAEIVKGRAQC